MTNTYLRVICCLLVAWSQRSTGETARLLIQDIDETGREAGGGSDSLRPALEAISRRQRDLAGRPYDNYGGLGRYRYEPTKRNGDGEQRPDDLEFLSMADDNGQPEDIGYGYQRGGGRGGLIQIAGGGGRGGGRVQTAAGARALEKLLMEYLEGTREEEDEGPEDEGMEAEEDEGERRSSFRERGTKRALGRFVGPPLTTSPFRERLRGDEGEEEGEEGEEEGSEEEKRKRFLAMVKRLEEEAEEEAEEGEREGERRRRNMKYSKEARVGEEVDSGYDYDANKLDAYLEFLEDLWDKYKSENPGKPDGGNCDKDNAEAREMKKRPYGGSKSKSHGNGGPSYDYFNSPMGWMGGGAGGYDSFGRKRRGGAQLEDERDAQKLRNLIFALKSSGYVPRLQLAEEEEEEDGGYHKRESEPEPWFPAQDKPRRWAPGESDGEMTGEAAGLAYSPRQRRFPVAKRAFKRSSPVEAPKRRKKEIKTDPKVAKALSHIFGGDGTKKNETNGTVEHSEKEKKKKAEEGKEAPEENKASEEKRAKEKSGEKEVVDERKGKEEADKKEVKKSIDWSEYFGIDRRRKKSEGKSGAEKEEVEGIEGKTAEEEKLDDWLLNQYYKTLAMSTNIVKRKRGGPGTSEAQHRRPQPSYSAGRDEEEGDEKGLDAMDGKLRRVEDAIVEEAIKDTGAHEGTPGGRKEAEEVRGRVLSRLAAAYSLEKMRKALGEFKASLQDEDAKDTEDNGERISDGHVIKGSPRHRVPEGAAEDDGREEMEEGRGSGGMEEEEEEEEEKRRKKKRDEEGVFLGPPLAEPMSEGYMGGRQGVDPRENALVSGGECPALERLTTNCQGIGDLAGDYQHLFLDLCNWHEVCYICGSATSSSNGAAVTSCDITFLREVDSLCHGHEGCRQSGRRMAVALRALRGRGGKPLHHHQSKSASLCWQHPCLADYLARRRRR